MKLTANTPAGVFTRATKSPYTHVVVWASPRAAKERNFYSTSDQKPCGVSARWVKDDGYGVTWHGSEASARKATRAYFWDSAATLVGVFPVEAA